MAKKKEEVVITGNVDAWKLICSAKSENFLKSTKAMGVTGGLLVQVSTQTKDGLAESVVFVPNGKIIEKDGIYTVA